MWGTSGRAIGYLRLTLKRLHTILPHHRKSGMNLCVYLPFICWEERVGFPTTAACFWSLRFPFPFLILLQRWKYFTWKVTKKRNNILKPDWCLLIPEIINRIKDYNSPVPLRPSLLEERCNERMITLLRACWDENPERRPTFSHVKRALRDSSPEGWMFFYCMLLGSLHVHMPGTLNPRCCLCNSLYSLLLNSHNFVAK